MTGIPSSANLLRMGCLFILFSPSMTQPMGDLDIYGFHRNAIKFGREAAGISLPSILPLAAADRPRYLQHSGGPQPHPASNLPAGNTYLRIFPPISHDKPPCLGKPPVGIKKPCLITQDYPERNRSRDAFIFCSQVLGKKVRPLRKLVPGQAHFLP